MTDALSDIMSVINGDRRWCVVTGDCLSVLTQIPDASVHAVVTDPPYGLSFMGKRWDYDVPSVEAWSACLRALTPGGHLLVFAGTRTQHRMCCRIEDAGFDIRDMIAWVYGSGFPKSLDVSKAIDKAAGSSGERGPLKLGGERLARLENGKRDGEGRWGDETGRNPYTYVACTDSARQWQGWGTALKPALEPITVARKPLDGTVAENVQRWGTGAINVDGCRVAHGGDEDLSKVQRQQAEGRGISIGKGFVGANIGKEIAMYKPGGRWPANLIHDGGEAAAGLNGSARYFYCPKASKADRDEGLDGFEYRTLLIGAEGHKINTTTGKPVVDHPRRNNHPTVKPTDLMRYLCRLVTPTDGLIIDPFTGSGSTGKAAMLEGFRFIGIERDETYANIARARIAKAEAETALLAGGCA